LTRTAPDTTAPTNATQHIAAPNTTQRTAPPNTTASNSIQRTTELKGADSKLDTAIVRAQTKDALVSLGWTPSIATAAVAAAVAILGTNVTLEQLIREALRCCPLPKA
jgi:Holliday junction resolvasome RuvABC DNA-binding subunit